jgi:hypothetical protein
MTPSQYTTLYRSIAAMLPDGGLLTLNGLPYVNLGYSTPHNFYTHQMFNLIHALAYATGQHRKSEVFRVRAVPLWQNVTVKTIKNAHSGKGAPNDIRRVMFALGFCLGIGRGVSPDERLIQQELKGIFKRDMSCLRENKPAACVVLQEIHRRTWAWTATVLPPTVSV